jgi:hypothetical protein
LIAEHAFSEPIFYWVRHSVLLPLDKKVSSNKQFLPNYDTQEMQENAEKRQDDQIWRIFDYRAIVYYG